MKEEQIDDPILNLINKEEQPSESEKQDDTLQKEFKVMKRLATCDLKETNQDEKDKILMTRFNKFFLYNLKKNKANDYLDEKPMVDFYNPAPEIDHKRLLIYGTDFMNKKKISDYLQLKDEKINTLNSSSSQIVAKDPDRIMHILSRVIIHQEEMDNLAGLQWVDLQPYYDEQGIERKMEGRLGTNKDIIKRSKGTKDFVEQQTKIQYYKQSIQNKAKKARMQSRRRPYQDREYQIYQKRLNPPANLQDKQSQSNLSFPRNNNQTVINVQSSSEEEKQNDNVSESINNFDFSLSLDISVIQDRSRPDIYDQPRNVHKFKNFNKFSYKDYNKEQEIKEKDKNKEIKVIVLEDD